MGQEAWKRTELGVARDMGGSRTTSPAQTSPEKTNADVHGVPEYVEIKRRKTSAAHEALADLSERARRRDRDPALVYELLQEEGPALRWVALWFDRFLEDRDEGEWAGPPLGARPPWLVEHRVGRRLTHGTLVEETLDARLEEGHPGPVVVVVAVHGSPRKVALLPREEWGL